MPPLPQPSQDPQKRREGLFLHHHLLPHPASTQYPSPLSLLSTDAPLRRPQCSGQGRAGLLQSLLGLARARSPGTLWPWRRYRAGAKSGSQLRARKCQLGAGHRHRLGSCSCRDEKVDL